MSDKIRRVLYVLPNLTSYILPLISGMGEFCFVDVIYSPVDKNKGYGENSPPRSNRIRWIKVNTLHILGRKNFGKFQVGILPYMVKNNPDAVIIGANPNYISFWFVLILGWLLKIPIYSRGHGLIKKKQVGFLHKIIFKIIVNFSKKYLCYTPSVLHSLEPYVSRKNKLVVDYNYQYNKFLVYPALKSGKEDGILFTGRLREDCGIELLINVIEELRDQYPKLVLHVIGGGVLSNFVYNQAKSKHWIKFHGLLYDDEAISSISKNCRLGCVAGDAGLGIVHMMSLSLPPVTHYDMDCHMGPEPSYIQPGINGVFYGSKFDSDALKLSLLYVLGLPPEKMLLMQKNAFDTYQFLSTPPFHERILKLIDVIN